jgi:hypothetical protein
MKPLPTDLAKLRDELAMEHKHDIGSKSNESFRRGFDACFAALCEMAPEFDEQILRKYIIDHLGIGVEDESEFTNGARWQFEQSRAREAVLRAEIALLIRNMPTARQLKPQEQNQYKPKYESANIHISKKCPRDEMQFSILQQNFDELLTDARTLATELDRAHFPAFSEKAAEFTKKWGKE